MPLSQESVPVFLNGWTYIILAFAVAGIAGFAAGLLYRAGAAIILAFVTAGAGFFLSSNQGWSFWQSALYAFGLITVLQIGYLIGASLSVTWSRATAKTSLRGLIAGLFKQKTAP